MSEPPITNRDPRSSSSHDPGTPNHEAVATSHDDDGITLLDLLDLITVLVKHKWLIFGLPVLAAVLAATYALSLTNIYTANAKILPPQHGQSTASAMLAQLGNIGVGLGGLTGIKSPNDLYIAMLQSRRLADNMIQRLDLNTIFQHKSQSDTRDNLQTMSKFTTGKEGFILIEVSDSDPKRAANLANAYIEELNKLTNVLALTEASQRRLFFERQLAEARENLAKAEIVAKQALEKGGLALVESQGRAMVEATSRLRGEITAKEVQIGTMRAFAADANPELFRAQRELESLKRELAKIEGTGGGMGTAVGSSGQGMDSPRLLRDLKYYETIYELLAKQYELAKIDEAKDPAIVQVLDKAIEPEKRSKPNRVLIVLVTGVVAGFFAMLLAFLIEALDRVRGDPEGARRLRLVHGYLIGKQRT